MKPFQPRKSESKRKASAIALIKLLLQHREPTVIAAHRNELLSILLWKLTEAESDHKHGTRFQSAGALAASDSKLLRHEHVFQREKMIAVLLQATPREVENILAKAVACTVTLEENKRLAAHESDFGWER